MVPATDEGVGAKIAMLTKGDQSSVGGPRIDITDFELLNMIVVPAVPIIKAGKLSLQYVSGASVKGSIDEAMVGRAQPKRIMYL